MAVYPTSSALQIGLGGSFREILINEQYVQLCLSLSELADPTIEPLCRDISGNGRHGTYTTSGLTHGVSLDIAEGGLGTTFDGTSYAQVVDVYGIQALSLDAGSVDLVALIKTSTNDATLRAIIQKQDTDSAGNGYHLALQSGAVRFFLRVAGSTIFNFSRGSVSDGQWHLIHCHYDPALSTGEARIFIDGVQSGATVTGVSTEPGVTSGNFRVGMFNDGAGGFIGSVAYATIGREGNIDLGVDLQAARQWTNVWADVRQQMNLQMRRGITGSSVLDNVAKPSTLSFAMNNAATNSGGVLGYYAPGHASCRANFQIGAPVRWSVVYGGVTYYEFRGRIKSISPTTGAYRDRLSIVTAVGWLDVATSVVVSALEAQTDIRSDDVFRLALDQAEGRSPAAVSISTGSSQFPFALDVPEAEQDSILTEITRVASSERGYIYELGDTVQGGTLKYEGRGDRQIKTDLDATFSNSMHGLEVTYTHDHVVNIVRVQVTPRSVDTAATTVLYRLENSQQAVAILPGQTLVLEGGYTDPSQKAQRVGGTAMVTPVAGTDYSFFANSDGSGANLTANLEIVAALGGNSFRIAITNPDGFPGGYLRLNATTAFQLRGKGIYHYTPVTVERRNNDSVRRHGPRTVQIDLQYESSIPVAEGIADFYLNILGNQRPMPNQLIILANHSNTLMVNALDLDVGDKVGLDESASGITTDDPDSDNPVGYFINEKQLTYAPGGIIAATFTLAPSAPAGVFIWDESVWDESTTWAF